MKSRKEELMKRGYADKDMIQSAQCLNDEQLLKQCLSAKAWERTAAVYALKQPDRYADFYVKMLSNEKKLYPRIACSEVLAKGNVDTAKVLISWLGKIGSNQHRSIGKTSLKKSYPLPRDLIARIIARMDGRVCPLLFEDHVFSDESKLAEALDAIGFMVYYNQHLADLKMAALLMKLLDDSANMLIRWKAVTALSAFPLPEVKQKLLCMLKNKEEEALFSEIKRSIKQIDERMEE